MIGGEDELDNEGICNEDTAQLRSAKENNALVIQLEHRFYGKTQIYDLSAESLKYATSEQALEDLAYFMPKFVTIGCSYPGTLSARLRLKYPQLTQGAIAGSAPLYPMESFTQFGQYVETILNKYYPGCSNAFTAALKELHNKLQTSDGRKEVNTVLKVDPEIDVDNPKEEDKFLVIYTIIEELLTTVMDHGDSDKLPSACETTTKDNSNLQKLLLFYQIATDYNEKKIHGNYEKSKPKLKIQIYIGKSSDTRVWCWQQCNELGWFQPVVSGMFKDLLPLEYPIKICEKLFSITPEIFHQRIKTAQANFVRPENVNTSNLLLLMNEFDPWQTIGSFNHDESLHLISHTTKGIGHCQDMGVYSKRDSTEKKTTHDLIAREIKYYFSLNSTFN